MARFLAAIQGMRGEASRLGSSSSGIRAQAQGWNTGVKVYGSTDGDLDVFNIYITGGSSDTSERLHVGTLRGNTFSLANDLRGIHVKTV
jgi:hypothetical protein